MLKGLRKFSSFSQPSRDRNLRTKPTSRRSLSPDDVTKKPLTSNIDDDSVIVKRVIARHDYDPVNAQTDLALVRGLQYDILDSTGVWWMARDPETGEIGLIPFNYVQVICDDDHEDDQDDPPEMIAKHTSSVDVEKIFSSSASAFTSTLSTSFSTSHS